MELLHDPLIQPLLVKEQRDFINPLHILGGNHRLLIHIAKISDLRLQCLFQETVRSAEKDAGLDPQPREFLNTVLGGLCFQFPSGRDVRDQREMDCIEAEKIEQRGVKGILDQADGILVPGGFGDRGSEGKIKAVRYARENGTPFLGICLGMQMAVAEFARNVCGLAAANSSEFDEQTPHPVIHLMDAQREIKKKGGTMRLGGYACVLKEGSLAFKLYGRKKISERHRHRYEFNNSYRELFSTKGMILSGLSPDKTLVEVIELKDHPWFVGCQFHPEFKSRPTDCHPLYKGFIKAALQNRLAQKEVPRIKMARR